MSLSWAGAVLYLIRTERKLQPASRRIAMKQTFGQFLKAKRLALDLSLREFARKIGMQPSNYCNIESDVLPPPPAEGLERIGKVLGLKKGTPDYTKFHDLSALGPGRDSGGRGTDCEGERTHAGDVAHGGV